MRNIFMDENAHRDGCRTWILKANFISQLQTNKSFPFITGRTVCENAVIVLALVIYFRSLVAATIKSSRKCIVSHICDSPKTHIYDGTLMSHTHFAFLFLESGWGEKRARQVKHIKCNINNGMAQADVDVQSVLQDEQMNGRKSSRHKMKAAISETNKIS